MFQVIPLRRLGDRLNVRKTIGCAVWLVACWIVPASLSAQSPDRQKDPEQAAMHTNRLIDETSPYLLQHAHNPVDWYPWGDEAFEKARREDKPIFLSVGYSTCYWCHVMEIESFEDPEVAKVINEHFVPIKVDREERPDIDEQYMLATQLMTQRGGWPNSVWLMPDRRPWMAGTYFPKKRFVAVLEQVADFWSNRRDDVTRQAESLAKATREMNDSVRGDQTELKPLIVDRGVQVLLAQFDETHGGFGGAPKFPPHGTLGLLIDRYQQTKDPALLPPITKTLDAMWFGGMHDHIGGGFHRYATDTNWLLPHFEKMLYDNGQLLRLYADGYALTSLPRYRDAVDDIFVWLQREMTSPRGAFYSAIDSGEVGKEGEAYVWSAERLRDVLGEEDAKLFVDVYNILEQGNFHEESTGERTGKNIPHLAKPIREIAETRSLDPDELKGRLRTIREKLLADRLTWPQPHKDDKILTSWNGLMIAALARAGDRLNDQRYVQAAIDAADFIEQKLIRDGKLLRTYRDGTAKQPGYLDDYAYFCDALLELHTVSEDRRWLGLATSLVDVMLSDFQDEAAGGFFFTGDDYETLIVRSRGLGGGGNLPNANGVTARVLLRLHELTDNGKYLDAAAGTLRAFASQMAGQPHTNEDLLTATADYLQTREAERISDVTKKRQPDQSERVGPVSIRVSVSPAEAAHGKKVELTVTLQIDAGWHLYADNPDADFVTPTQVNVSSDGPITAAAVRLPDGEAKADPVLKQTLQIYRGTQTVRVPVSVDAQAEPGEATVRVTVKFQACDDQRCLQPQSKAFQLPIRIR